MTKRQSPFRCDYSQHPSDPCWGAVCVPLTKGYHALIDAADFHIIGNWRWSALLSRGHIYARREIGKLHKLLMGEAMVDHANRNSLDNRRSNLRTCTKQQNNWNQKARIGTSAYKGVSYRKVEKKWAAQITINGKRTTIGRYKTEIEAAQAYDVEAIKLHGEFAVLNFQALRNAGIQFRSE